MMKKPIKILISVLVLVTVLIASLMLCKGNIRNRKINNIIDYNFKYYIADKSN